LKKERLENPACIFIQVTVHAEYSKRGQKPLHRWRWRVDADKSSTSIGSTPNY